MIGFLNEQPDELPSFMRPLLAIRGTGYRAADRQGDLFLGCAAGPPPAGK